MQAGLDPTPDLRREPAFSLAARAQGKRGGTVVVRSYEHGWLENTQLLLEEAPSMPP